VFVPSPGKLGSSTMSPARVHRGTRIAACLLVLGGCTPSAVAPSNAPPSNAVVSADRDAISPDALTMFLEVPVVPQGCPTNQPPLPAWESVDPAALSHAQLSAFNASDCSWQVAIDAQG
jgi:hypothetical protein